MNMKNTQSIRKKPEQTRSINRVNEILNAAKDLIVDRGIDQFTMKDIADRAAMKPTALYRYFPNKQSVMRELTLQMFEDDNRLVMEAMVNSDATIETIIEQGSYNYWELHKTEPYRIKLNLAIQSDPELWKLSVEESKKSVRKLCENFGSKLSLKDTASLERKVLLNVVLMTSAINLATSFDEGEAQLIMDDFLQMTLNNMKAVYTEQ